MLLEGLALFLKILAMLLAPAVGRYAFYLLENPGKMSLIGKAASHCNIYHGTIRRKQHLPRLFDSIVYEKLMRGLANGFLNTREKWNGLRAASAAMSSRAILIP